jgi:hypothetical protein
MARALTSSTRWTPLAREAKLSSRELATAVYVGTVIATGLVLLVWLAPRTYPNPLLTIGLLSAALALSLFKLRLPLANGVSTMTLAYAVDFLALLVAGANVAMVIAAAGVLLQCTVRVRKAQPLHRTAFSVASVVISVQATGWVWRSLGGGIVDLGIAQTLGPLSAAVIAYFVVNTALIAVAIAFSTAVSPTRAWHREFLWSAPSYFLSAVVAAVIATIMRHDAYLLLPLAALSAVHLLSRVSDFGATHRRRAPARARAGRHGRDDTGSARARDSVGGGSRG